MSFQTCRSTVRRAALLAALVTLGAGAAAGSAAAAEGFGIAKFESTTCNVGSCTEAETPALYTQADGHPPDGITFFELATKAGGLLGSAKVPNGTLSKVRTDLPLGFSVNPQVAPTCEPQLLATNECPVSTRVGTDEVVAYVPALGANLTVKGNAYNLAPREGAPLEVGIEIDELGGLVHEQVYLVGHVSWHQEAGIEPSGDYHEFFTIDEISGEDPIVSSRLVFEGNSKGTGYLTLPSICKGSTSILHVEDSEGQTASEKATPPLPVSGCSEVPFKPEVAVTPSTTEADKPDGLTVEVLVPQNKTAAEVGPSAVEDATIALPEGLTLNPAVANGLSACSNEQFGKGTSNEVKCPAASEIGAATIETPALPKGALTGSVYLGAPESSSPSSGREYRLLIATESKRYGVAVRLEGRVYANERTGQLSTLVAESPPIPFSDLIVKLDNEAHTPLANPDSCGTASTGSTFSPYTQPGVGIGGALKSPFTVTKCAAFAPQQSIGESTSAAGASTSFQFTLTRPEGQPYLSSLSATLPPGLVGQIPSVPLCEEAQASKAECAEASSIGTASIEAGSGGKPFKLGGTVYLTGPYDGAPYGAAIVTNAEKVGPYDYGKILTRAKLEINPSTAQVTISSQLPTIVGGAPIRLRSVTVNVDRPGFLLNPTSCGALTMSTAFTSTTGVTAGAASPFQTSGCGSLPFKPTFTAVTSAKTTRKLGAGLDATLTLPSGDANVQSVSVTLPKQLVARDSTLNQACLLATFDANPASCPAGSQVGTASIVTPVLPGTLTGKAYYVSLGHEGFPNLDVVLEGDGVKIVLVGTTNISGGVTTTTFPAVPDVPVKTFTLTLPQSEHSALSGEGSLCRSPLKLPTTIVGQNGAKLTQTTQLEVAGCPIVVIKHKVKGRKVTITLRTPAAGKVLVSGRGIVRKVKKASKAKIVTVTEKLSKAGLRKLAKAKKHRLVVHVHVKFTAQGGAKPKQSKASLKVRFKR
ncbi:MAG: hypothetical protein ACYCU0_06045 [Solirubrobacteraceae bacterium]